MQSQLAASSSRSQRAQEVSKDQQEDHGRFEIKTRRRSRVVVASRTNTRYRKNALPSKGEFRFRVDQQGRQHFNFRQQIWLDESVAMAHTPIYTMALKTLAVNLLTMTLNVRNVRAAIGSTSKTALSLAPAFSKQCLLGAPSGAWILPKTTIEGWLESAKRRRTAQMMR
jgi:hypothetical protein